MRLHRALLAPSLVAAFLAAPVLAEDAAEMTAEEIEALFENQLTRGLVLAPTEDTAATDTATENTGTTEIAGANEDYTALAPEEQVSIQINFAFDSAALEPSEQAKLATMCDVIARSDIPLFRVVGHTDSSGGDEYNQRLSLLRAEEVVRHLTEDCGIDPSRLQAVGVGMAFPLDPADPRADANRRVEFQVGV